MIFLLLLLEFGEMTLMIVGANVRNAVAFLCFTFLPHRCEMVDL